MRRVLAVRADSLGDVVLTGPAVRALAACADHVCLLAGPSGAEAARMLPGVDEVSVMRVPWIDATPQATDPLWIEQAVAQLTGLGCDEAVIFTSAYQSPLPLALLLRMAGVRRIGGISVARAGTLLDVRIAEDLDVHEVERALTLARACGFSLPADDDTSLRVRRAPAPASIADGFVLLHPGGTSPARQWSEERWIALAEELASRGRTLVITGSNDDRPAAARIVAAANAAGRAGVGTGAPAINLAGSTSLPELVEHIAAAACVVIGNTGPAHLAAAVGTPVVSLFAPTVPASRWRPWRTPHILLGDQEIRCAGCRATECPVPGHPCLESVTVDAALHAIDQLLAQTPNARRNAAPASAVGAPA